MALGNRGLFLLGQKRYQEARDDLENAVLISKEVLLENNSEEIGDRIEFYEKHLEEIRGHI